MLFIFLELSTARYCLFPGQELLLCYDSDDTKSNGGPVAVDLMQDGGDMTLVLWTGEDEMLHPDGQRAERCYDTSERMEAIYQQTPKTNSD